jgi:hypothetical protein
MPHLRGQTGGSGQETAARTASTTRTSRRRLRADAPAMLSIQFLRIYGPSTAGRRRQPLHATRVHAENDTGQRDNTD